MATNVQPPDLDDIARKANRTREELNEFLELVKLSMEPLAKRILVTENEVSRWYSVERRGIGILHTKYGKFWEYTFSIDDHWEKYSVVVKAEFDDELLIPIFKDRNRLTMRTDSGCEAGQVFGEITCECRQQLEFAMQTIAEIGEGLIINIPSQDGRGMGLTFKLATLWIQDVLGADTVDAAAMLSPGGVIDIRTYSGVICILKFFDIPTTTQIYLATNNSKKAEVFGENGYTVVIFTEK